MADRRKPYVVRQHPAVFMGFAGSGALLCVIPWLIDANEAFWMQTTVSAFGVMSLLVAAVGWACLRVGLVADHLGLWLAGYSLFTRKLVPWGAIVAAKKCARETFEGEQTYVVLDLINAESHPAAGNLGSNRLKQVIDSLDDPDYAIPHIVGNEEWDWDPDEFVAMVRSYIKNQS